MNLGLGPQYRLLKYLNVVLHYAIARLPLKSAVVNGFRNVL